MRRSPHALQVWYRYARFLGADFGRTVGAVTAVVLAGGAALALGDHREKLSYAKACYAVFCMVFFQPGVVDFPAEWYLQPLFFLLPLVGLGAAADSLVRLGYLVFTSKQKLPEWQRMRAMAMRDHTVVCGVGRVGYRVVGELVELGEPVVAIERDPRGELAAELVERGVVVLFGNARSKGTLIEANVAGARAVIAATDDDLANLDAALTAREINPAVRVVVRMFDDTLAAKVGGSFNMPAVSTSSCAAPSFVAAALGRRTLHPFELGGRRMHFADLVVGERSPLIGRTVSDLERLEGVRVVLLAREGGEAQTPAPATELSAGDAVAVVAAADALARLDARNRPV